MIIPSEAPTNRLALLSFITAFFTAASFCGGVVPIPFTAWVCYPAAILLGIGSLVMGLISLRQVRVRAEKGRAMALLGIWTGALTILAVLCFTSLTAILLFYGADTIRGLWPQPTP